MKSTRETRKERKVEEIKTTLKRRNSYSNAHNVKGVEHSVITAQTVELTIIREIAQTVQKTTDRWPGRGWTSVGRNPNTRN